MRRPLIAGNWKMNTDVEEATKLIKDMIEGLKSYPSVDRVICPPFISLFIANQLLKNTDIQLGAQNMYFKEKGAYTGEISPLMLKSMCKYVILGHSERRQIFLESSEMVNKKVKAAAAAGLLPIMCVGETLQENESGRTRDVLYEQVKEGLKGIEPNNEFIIAYEPIWAIGTGKAASGIQASTTIKFIRETIGKIWGTAASESTRILYGGSVTASNISEFIQEPQIDGALVGGASLKAGEFVDIVRQSAIIKQS